MPRLCGPFHVQDAGFLGTRAPCAETVPDMPCVSIEQLFSRKDIWRNAELRDEGVQFRDLQRALDEGSVARPVFHRRHGPVHGIFVSKRLNTDPERGLIVASVLTGGVIGRHSAGYHYGLTTDIPPRTEVHVRESFSRVPQQMPMLTMRSRNEDMRRLGVDWLDTEFGVQIPITTPARTVVDILHAGRSNDRDHEHGTDAIEAFLSSGGEPGEITNLASALRLDPDGRIDLVVNAVSKGMGMRRM
jgi:hypothetical protein